MKTNHTLGRLIAVMTAAWLLVCCIHPITAAAATYNAVIPVSQEFTETEAPEGKVFKYSIKPVNGGPISGFKVSGAGSMSLGSGGGAYEFSIDGSCEINLEYEGLAEGTYNYTLECVPDDRSSRNYIFDSAKYDITLHASGGTGAATVVIKDLNGNKPDGAKFVHSYGGADPFIMIDPPVRKRVEGNPDVEGTFRFRLRAVENTAGYEVKNMPMPEGSSNGEKFVSVIGEGEEEFGWWTYTKAGVYTYDISEVDPGDSRYLYDKTMYTLVDTVTRVDNRFEVKRVITDSKGQIVQNTLIRTSREATTVKLDYVNEYLPEGSDDGNSGDDGGSGSGGGNGDGDGGDGGSAISRLIPKTGDTAHTIMWSLLLGAAMLIILVMRIRIRKNN